MLLVVLVLIWVVALAPIAYRRYVDRQADTSVDRFRQRVLEGPARIPSRGHDGSGSRHTVPRRSSARCIQVRDLSSAGSRLQQRRERREGESSSRSSL